MKNRKFAALGRSREDVMAAMEAAHEADQALHSARIFKPVYYGGAEVSTVAEEASRMYLVHNALYGGSSFPSIRKYETEVIEMCLEMLHGPDGATGSCTAGGTESNIMAMKTARDWAREHLPQATAPEMIVPRTAHPSFEKAAHLLGVKSVRMAKSPGFVADVEGMKAAINANTILLVGSAPPYPYGQTDPIAEIAALAQEHGLWMHVDACLGGFILPFAKKLGEPIPDFDFSVPGVTSISADVHKFGYANKGVSALLLREEALYAYQHTVFDDWGAGTYITPAITASRSGGAVASGWAVMNYLGEEGYLRIVGTLLDLKKRFIAGINATDGLEVWAEPHAHHVTFGSQEFDVFAVDEAMKDRGWEVGRVGEPDAMLLFLNVEHARIVDEYLADLGDAVAAVRSGKRQAVGRGSVYAV